MHATTRPPLGKRISSVLAVTLVTGILIAGCSTPAPTAPPKSSNDNKLSGKITAAEWGGVWDNALQVVSPGFTTATGVDVVNSVNSGSVLAVLEQNPGLYDLGWVIGTTGVQAYEKGLTQAIDTSKIDNFDSLNPILVDAMTVDGELSAVPISFGTMGILYRSDLVDFKIDEWKDLWDPRLEGKITIQNAPSIGGLFVMMAAAEAFGKGIDDYEAGFKAMEKLKRNIQSLYANSAEPINALASGTASVAVTFANYGIPLKTENVEIVIPKGGSAWSVQAISIPKAATNPDAAYAFINYMLQKDTQVTWADAASIAPANTTVKLPANVRAKVLEDKDVGASLWPIDWVEFGKSVDGWTTRWQEIFAK